MRRKVRRAQCHRLFLRSPQVEGLFRIGEAVSLHAGCDHRGEVEALALERSKALLKARRLAHAGEYRPQAPQAFFRAVDVDARVRRCELQVLQRRAHHRDRGAQLVREPARHALQVGVVLRELGEHRREAAREVADLVARVLRGEQT